MSYILDALRKAQSQRERNRLPGLHDQALGPAVAEQPTRPRTIAAAALGAGLVAAAVLAWQFSGREEGVARGEAPPAAERDAPPPLVASVPAAPPTPPAAAAPTPAESILPPAPPPAPAPVEPRRPRVAAPAPESPPPAASQGPAARPGASNPPATPAAAAPTAAGAAPGAGAPPGAPPMSISGGVYSPDPAQRMLIVNGQVFNEGSEVAAGVTLVEVRPRQALMDFRGQRFTLPY